MQYTTLHGLDKKISRIAFGCMSTVPSQMYDGLGDDEAITTMRRAFELGINFFDTARAYADGESERQLGKAIASFRDEVVIASKPRSGDNSADEIAAECEKSLKDLGVDRIDLYQLHWPRREVPMEETARAMEKLIADGKVGAIGVCNFAELDLLDWLGAAPCATDQIAYSLLARGPEFGTQQRCEEHNVGILCYSPLAQALLTGRYATADDVPSGRARTRHFSKDRPEARHTEGGQEAVTFEAIAGIQQIANELGHTMAEVSLAWLLRRPAVAAVLTGASRPDQVERNAKAADVTMPDDAIAQLDAATDALKAGLGESIDMWQCPPRTR